MKKSNGLFWIALAVLLFIFISSNRKADEPAAPTPGLSLSTPAPSFAQPAPAPAAPAPTPAPPVPVADPYAYTARDWQQAMPSPSAGQIDQARGTARSPYVSIYPHYPGVNRVLEYSVDLHADHQPLGTYLCPLNWWMDVSALQARYVSVYNDYTGIPGGYCGFQTLADGSRVFIMTVWSTFCQDAAGNVTVFTPRVLYPEGQGSGNTDMAEGSFTHVILPYDWRPGRDYRVLLQTSRSEQTGNTVLTAFVCDLQTYEWTMLASFDTGVAEVYPNSAGGFLENFLPDYAGEVRSMQLRNLRARSADTGQWVSADSVQFLLNSSVSQLDYTGSAAYGADGDAIWAITSGVNGLCPTPSDNITYPLSPGDSSDPY